MSDSPSFADKIVAGKGNLIHKLKAKDTTGEWAYYFLLVNPIREAEFLKAHEKQEIINLEDYGTIIASCYGEEPTPEVRTLLKERYGFEA